MTPPYPHQADEEENRSNQDVKAMEAGGHKEARAINIARKAKGGMAIFINLKHGKDGAQSNRNDQAHFHVFAIILMHQSMVRPSRGRP